MINLSNLKKLSINNIPLVRLLANGVEIWRKFINWARCSTESDGYTIYNDGLGYKTGYRVRSGGEESESAGNVCTGFIPCKAGDTIRVYSPVYSAFGSSAGISAFNFYNGSKTNLGQVVSNSSGYGIFSGSYEWRDRVTIANGMATYTVSETISGTADIESVRVTVGFLSGHTSAEGLIITVNEEIT